MFDKKKILNELSKFKIPQFNLLKDKLNKFDSPRDILYHANIEIFQSSQINHKKRLSLLKKINLICVKLDLHFCIAHNLTLSIKVSREIGYTKNLIDNSHEVIRMWKKIINEDLAINGLIFSYIDIGLIYSDYNLLSLSMKYLLKAEALISETNKRYNPYIKLYIAMAVVHNKLKENQKALKYYDMVYKEACRKKDTITMIPVLVNTADMILETNKDNKLAKNKLLDALKLSDKNNDIIYKPYIYRTLSKSFLFLQEYKKSKEYIELSINLFEKNKSSNMISKCLFDLGIIYYSEKKYDKAIYFFNRSKNKNKLNSDCSLNIQIIKMICKINKKNKDTVELLKNLELLSILLEKESKLKTEILSDMNKKAIDHLVSEFDSSLKDNENLQLKIKLESKKRELTTKTLRSVSEKEFLKKIINQLGKNQTANREIIDLCKIRLANSKSWKIFMKLFNDINPDFNMYILKKCSDITESELRVCNLIKMNFSSNEIAEILSITIRGVEQHRYRIKKKLNLNKPLTIFIQSL